MNVLVVVAHPDDEILGCGGTTAMLTAKGVRVTACMLSGDVEVRQHRPDDEALLRHIDRAQTLTGAEPAILGAFPNIRFNTVPHVELVQFIEESIIVTGAQVVFTHHPADLNDDHRQTSLACQAAVRLFQRRPGVLPLRALYYMEIPSSTDWAFPNGDSGFVPTAFSPVGSGHIDTKLAALAAYEGVMRPFPHPRSPEVIKGLAAVRGGASGVDYAEAFQVAFRSIEETL